MAGRLGFYVMARAGLGVALAAAVLAGVVLLTEIVEIARTLGGHGDADFVDIVELALLRTPFILVQLTAFAFLFGAMAALVTLNRRGELVVMRAAGVSAWSFLAPTMLAAVGAGILVVVALQPLAVQLEGAFDARKANLGNGGAATGSSDIWLRQGDGEGQTVIHARRHETRGDAVLLSGVSMFVQRIGPSGRLMPSRRIEAGAARLTPGAWRLTDVRETTPAASEGGGEIERAEQLSIPSSLDRATTMEKFVSPAAVPIWQLPHTVRAARAAGYSPARYQVRLQQLLATPLMLAAMTLLAASVSLRLTRLGQLPLLIALGVAAGFAVFFFEALCRSLGSAEILPPLVAGWSPPLLTACFGAAVLCYTEDG